MIQAEYLGRQWEISENVVKALDALGLNYELDYEEKESTNGKNQIDVKGVKAQDLNIGYVTALSLGSCPIEEFFAWYNLRGKKDFLFLGNKQYGADQFILKSVEFNTENVYNDGTILEGKITLSLSQDSSSTRTDKKKVAKINPVKARVEAAEKKKEMETKAIEPNITDGMEVCPTPTEKAALLGV